MRINNDKSLPQTNLGFLLVEILLAIAVFSGITLIVLSAFVYGEQTTNIAGDSLRATDIANSEVAAVQNIAQGSYANLSNYSNGTTYYLTTASNQWSLSTTPSLINGIYTPEIIFSNGPTSGRIAKVTVTWKETPQRTGTITATTYLTDWQSLNNINNQQSVKLFGEVVG